jgi:protease IV
MRKAVVAVVAGLLGSRMAYAQIDRRYAEEPTDGMALPTAPLAGEHDARVVATNPGGLPLVRGTELALVLDLEDPDIATTSGQGFGTFLALAGGGGRFLPRFGLGLGLEWLRPSRSQLTPDPGAPFRFTLGTALGLGRNAGFGMSWHHFHDDGILNSADTFDLGLSTRWGNWLAIGATLRDVATNPIGGSPIQRRYELETVVRPLGTDRLDAAVGGRLGETRLDVDGWARVSLRAARGVYVHAGLESRALHVLADSPTGQLESDDRDYRGTLGLEISLGGFGVTALATGLRDDAEQNHALGAQLVVRTSSVGPPSVFGHGDHIERVELSGTIGVRELTSHVTRLRAIARDPSAKAVVVTFDSVSGGWATMQELRDELARVKQAGKKVFAYMVSGTGRDYFIASAAHKIYIDPAGGLRLVGIAGTTMFFRGAFDQLGVLPQFEKIAEYKSAPEQFTETGPTKTAAQMTNDMFDSLWDQWLTAVADGRKLTKDELKALIDGGPYSSGDLAANTKLVDAVATPEKVSQLVTAELGGALPVTAASAERPDRWQRPGIAVIYVDGDITDGKSQNVPIWGKLAGGETLVGALTAARNDPRIGAIILRIDSPGGSALASELVSREVFATRGVKPILCSMSDLAASGGYFVAAGCEVIYAEPMTITGSIGIFSGKFDISGLAKKLGVTTDTYKRGKRADAESYFRAYSDEERGVLMEKLRYMYGRFVGAVSEGRKLKKDEVDAVGRGHVWTGAMARPIKLVDKFGGLGDALDDAKQRMGLAKDTRVAIVELPDVPSSLLGTVGGLIGVQEQLQPQLFELPALRDLVRAIPAGLVLAPGTAQARLPFDIIWSQ